MVVAPINALILAEHMPHARLNMYPDSSHGAQYEHREVFLEHVKFFLAGADSATSNVDSIKSSVALPG
jgi:pimeloyl-ACP methyl ester carboxylesterase